MRHSNFLSPHCFIPYVVAAERRATTSPVGLTSPSLTPKPFTADAPTRVTRNRPSTGQHSRRVHAIPANNWVSASSNGPDAVAIRSPCLR